MYNRDVPILREYGLGSEEGFRKVALFAILSANQPFKAMRMQMEDVKHAGDRSKFLYSGKREGYRYGSGKRPLFTPKRRPLEDMYH